MNEKSCNQEQAMILTDTVEAGNEKMEEMTSAQDQHIVHDGHNSSYPKRSNVAGMWKKREEAKKFSNVMSIENASWVDFEEKKEGIQEIEHDSRQQEKSYSATLPCDSKTVGSERNAPEPTTDANSDVGASRRSNIRNSWKKKAANIESIQLRQLSLNAEKMGDIMITASDSIVSPQSQSSFRGDIISGTNLVVSATKSTDLSTSAKRSNVRNSWRKISSASPSKEGSGAFDELKSKWAKFGVQTEDNPTTESDPNEMAEREVKEKIQEIPLYESVPPRDRIGEKTTIQDEKSTPESPMRSSNKDTQEGTKQDTKSPGSQYEYSPRSRRMSSKRFRPKYARKPLAVSTSSTDEIMGVTKNASADLIDSEKKISNQSVSTNKSPSPFLPSIEKKKVPSFPLDEIVHNESDLHVNTNVQENSREIDNNACRSFVPIQSPESISKDISKSTSRQENITEVALSGSGSWGEDSSNMKEGSTANSNISRSSLSSRANRRLRDIRMRNQMRKEEVSEQPSKETDTNCASGLSSSKPRSKTNESHGSTIMPMDESAADGASFVRSPLHDVVPDVKGMVPDEFVSEKNANVESFKTAYKRTSFEQIANDMKEETTSLFGMDILNEGIHSAMNKLGLGDIFQTSPRKAIRRAPSPVEEVAIEVEYIADS